jgi:hypothetical protein
MRRSRVSSTPSSMRKVCSARPLVVNAADPTKLHCYLAQDTLSNVCPAGTGAALLRMLRAYFQRNAQPMPRLRRQLLAAASGETAATLADRHSAAAWSGGRVLQGAAAGSGNSSGDDSFITGLQQYLAAHKFGSATTADLWDALGQASGMRCGLANIFMQQGRGSEKLVPCLCHTLTAGTHHPIGLKQSHDIYVFQLLQGQTSNAGWMPGRTSPASR